MFNSHPPPPTFQCCVGVNATSKPHHVWCLITTLLRSTVASVPVQCGSTCWEVQQGKWQHDSYQHCTGGEGERIQELPLNRPNTFFNDWLSLLVSRPRRCILFLVILKLITEFSWNFTCLHLTIYPFTQKIKYCYQVGILRNWSLLMCICPKSAYY